MRTSKGSYGKAFHGILVVFKDKKKSKEHSCPFYGFRIEVYVDMPTITDQFTGEVLGRAGERPICGIINWEARFTKDKQACELGLQIAEDFGVSISATRLDY